MIKGFEKDVGTKTSFYGFTVNTMKNSLISYGNLGFTSVPQGQVRLLTGMQGHGQSAPLFPEPLRGANHGPSPGDGEVAPGSWVHVSGPVRRGIWTGTPIVSGSTGLLWNRA